MGQRAYAAPVVLAILSVSLGGCAIPIAVSAASYGFDGLSYAAEGRSLTDLALSQTVGQNCALFRVFRGKAVCRDYTLEEKRDIAVARLESDKYDPHSFGGRDPLGYAKPKTPSPVLVAEAREAQTRLDEANAKLGKPDASMAARDSARPGLTTASFRQTVASDGKRVVRPVDHAVIDSVAVDSSERATYAAMYPKPPLKKALDTQYASMATWLPLPTEKSSDGGAAKAVVARLASVPVTTVTLAVPVAPPSPSVVRTEGTYLVLGSFSTQGNAERALARYADAKPLIVSAMVNGKTYHRLVIGPYKPGALARARAHAAVAYNIHHAWTITLTGCAPSGTAACSVPTGRAAKAAPQLASLPAAG